MYSTNWSESEEALRDAKGGALLERQQRLEVCVHLFDQYAQPVRLLYSTIWWYVTADS